MSSSIYDRVPILGLWVFTGVLKIGVGPKWVVGLKGVVGFEGGVIVLRGCFSFLCHRSMTLSRFWVSGF